MCWSEDAVALAATIWLENVIINKKHRTDTLEIVKFYLKKKCNRKQFGKYEITNQNIINENDKIDENEKIVWNCIGKIFNNESLVLEDEINCEMLHANIEHEKNEKIKIIYLGKQIKGQYPPSTCSLYKYTSCNLEYCDWVVIKYLPKKIKEKINNWKTQWTNHCPIRYIYQIILDEIKMDLNLTIKKTGLSDNKIREFIVDYFYEKGHTIKCSESKKCVDDFKM